MGFASSHVRGNKFDINTEGFEFKKISEFELGKQYTVRGALISKGGKFGDSPSLILDDCFMNLPSHALDDVKDLLSSEDAIAQCNAGKLAVEIYEYDDTKFSNAKQRSIKWIDLD